MISPVKLWRNQKQIRELIGKVGKIISFTIIRVPPSHFESLAPYPVALVEFSKKRYIGQLVDVNVSSIRMGQTVQAVVRRVREPDSEGVIPYGIKFKVIQQEA